ncbi:undecaprenyldiphospho-muramoylpentapeptide beta-N-acetylglucosaminyltransferase [Polycladidibacter stylochi]|uniref:undecaprenyldiphospho-muramoylpentapeptide beta-N-acetylglucosaminyltransferase n=1 Tax=Polycladidibacter stylochi TaxID=1807766 RepID=UPI00082AB7BA|nr:undecaprenyldiphospho-muramoylpentapeptide beta-N-acetylglucosaminyltransferase [Pseudovibrio stylochi]
MKTKIMLCAGGTGGHLFPAEALADELTKRGYAIELMSDERADKYGSAFPADQIHIIKSDTLRGRNPLKLLKTAVKLGLGTLQAWKIMRTKKPKVLVGFGGYPTFPPMFAARLAGVPTILHEANAVMGRANKMLAQNVKVIASNFELKQLDGKLRDKMVVCGNPLRTKVLAQCGQAYRAPGKSEPLRLLVFGGSQGARVFSKLLPQALTLLSAEERRNIKLVQQCRPEDIEAVQACYAELGIEAELASFFQDLPAKMAGAHLVVSRSGAMTVSELAALGRPAMLVPLPGALDNDQKLNAQALADAGGALMVEQKNLDGAQLATHLRRFMQSPAELERMAAAALEQGHLDAVDQLANIVEDVAGLRRPKN